VIKKITFFAFYCLFVSMLHAQQTDYETIVQPVENKARDFQEYLVQLAWMNNPESLIAQEETKISKDREKNIKKEWMKDVAASFNVNEVNLRQSGDNVFFPRYNFGVGLNLNNIITQKTKNKIGKRETTVAEQKANMQKLALRSETLTRYARFNLARNIYKARVLAEQEVYANYVLIKQLYESDEKTFEEYSAANKAWYTAQEEKLEVETDVLTARYALEEIIGLKWEQVQHPEKVE
jgi:outer membrane protein TolC